MVQELQDPDNDNFNPDSSSNKRSYDGATKVSKKRKAVGNFLSEDEKKARHIASEKKRRETIRLAFDRIVELVPDLTPAESRTEVAVLSKSANFIDQLRTENLKLIELLQQEKVEIPDHLVEAFSKPPQQAPSYDKK